jgi:hypothetical protein
MPTTTATPPVSTKAVENTVHTLTESLETSIKIGFDLQQALVESSVSMLTASMAATKTAVDQWLAFSKQQQPGLLSAFEQSFTAFEKPAPGPR